MRTSSRFITQRLLYALALGAAVSSLSQAAADSGIVERGAAAGTEAARTAGAAMAAALAEDKGAGAQVAVVVGGELVWSAAVGAADLEAGVPMTPDTRLRIGSVSKVFTAALAARLVEDGRLDPDAPVQAQVPDFPDKPGGAITVRRLASHTSGIRHYDFGNMAEANNTFMYESLEQALPVFSEDPLAAPPGSGVTYSSFGFNLLGVVAGRAAGAPYLQALAELVTGPLGLARTAGDMALPIVEGRGRFYTVRPDGLVINTLWRDSSDYYPSGGLLSTAEDMARLARASLAGPEPLGSAAHALLTTPSTLADGTPTGYTFGWQVTTADDGSVLRYEHGGLTNGATAEVRYDPASDLAVAVVANYNFWFEGQPSVVSTAVEEVAALFSRN